MPKYCERSVDSGRTAEALAGQVRSVSGVFLFGTLVTTILVYFLSTHGTWNPRFQQNQAGFAGDFYLAQAQAMLHGTFAVTPAQLPDECWVVHKQCIGYFGITPSLLRMPFLPLLDDIHDALDPVFLTAALTLAVGSAMAVVRRLLRRVDRVQGCLWVVVPAALVVGPGSVLVTLARPAVYEEAIAWAVGFLCLSVYCLLRWWETLGRRWLALLTVSLLLACCARPTALAAAVVIGLAVGIQVWRRRHDVLRSLSTTALVGALPVAAGLAVFVLKFGTPFPNLMLNQEVSGPLATPWWTTIVKIDHGHLQGLKFVPTALWTYLQPDALVFTRSFPWVNYGLPTRYLGLPNGSMLVQTVTSITDTMPLPILLGVFGLVQGLRAVMRAGFAGLREMTESPVFWGALAMAAACFIPLTTIGLEVRYLSDAYPLLALGLGYGAVHLVRSLSKVRPRWTVAAGTLMSCAAVATTGINLALAYQLSWHPVT